MWGSGAGDRTSNLSAVNPLYLPSRFLSRVQLVFSFTPFLELMTFSTEAKGRTLGRNYFDYPTATQVNTECVPMGNGNALYCYTGQHICNPHRWDCPSFMAHLPKSFLCKVFLFPCWAYTRESLAIISTNNSCGAKTRSAQSAGLVKTTDVTCAHFILKVVPTCPVANDSSQGCQIGPDFPANLATPARGCH